MTRRCQHQLAALALALALTPAARAQPVPRQAAHHDMPASRAGLAQVECVRGGTVASSSSVRETATNTTTARTGTTLPLAVGQALTEGARIRVPEDGYLRLRLADGSVVSVLAQSDVELRRLRRRGSTSGPETVIQMHRGKVESDVRPGDGRRVFEIHAPGAVASVRGTRFDVAIGDGGQVSTAVTEGTVAVQAIGPDGRERGRTMVPSGQGVVVDATGQLGEQRALPPAPDLSALSADHEQASGLVLDLGPLSAAATRYAVRITRDDATEQVVRESHGTGSLARFAALAQGDYTVGVRVVDAEGLAGPESRRLIRLQTGSMQAQGDSMKKPNIFGNPDRADLLLARE